MPPSKAERELGLRKIAEIREMTSKLVKPPNPFRHDHDGPGPCLVCGFEPEIPENVTRLRTSA
jgi:hypothetical protein